MEPWHYGMLLKPLFAIVMIFIARAIAVRIVARLPEGKIKRILLIRW
jgi:hypothetical protein